MSGDESIDGTTDEPQEQPQRPTLRIVRGDPSPEELAALTVVLAAASGGGDAGPEKGPVSFWADRASLVRRPVHPGRGAWVASARRF